MNKTNKKLGSKTQSKVSKNVKVVKLSKQQEGIFVKMAEGCLASLKQESLK